METPKDRSAGRSIDMDKEPTVADAIRGLPGHMPHHNDGEPAEQPPTYMERVYSGEYEAPEPEGSLADPDPDECTNCGSNDWRRTEDRYDYDSGAPELRTRVVEGRECKNCGEPDRSYGI